MKDLTTGNKVAIGVIAAVVAALIVLFAVFHRGVFLVLAIVTAVIAVLYFLGTILQKRQEQQDEAVQQTKQTVTMLVIDKKKMKMKEAGLPQQVMDATPKMLRRSKVPIVKAKVGPQILNMVCDERIFDTIPVKKQIKAGLEGLVGKVPGLLEVHVNIDGLASSNADLMLDTTLESPEALKGYAVHPAHLAVANGVVRPNTKSRVCFDFEI